MPVLQVFYPNYAEETTFYFHQVVLHHRFVTGIGYVLCQSLQLTMEVLFLVFFEKKSCSGTNQEISILEVSRKTCFV